MGDMADYLSTEFGALSDPKSIYTWKNNSKRATMYKRPCTVIARGAMNSVLIEFEDGQREIVSRNAVRRLK